MPATAAVVPADSEELFRVYYSYVRSLVRRRPGIPAQEVDDIASEIMTRILERDVLGMFDPSKHIEYQGQTVPPNFRTFLSGIVLRYIRGQHDKFGRRIKHETTICDAPAGDNVSWVELFGGFVSDDYPSLGDGDFVTRMRTYLAMVPPRSARDQLNLVELFDELCAEMFVDGKIRPRYIKERFGVTSSTVQAWMTYLREVLEPFTAGEDAPPVVIPEPLEVCDGVTLTLADAQSALAILLKVKGMHFKGDLLKAGHPLGDPALNVKGQEWFHPVARAEMKTYPECKLPPVSGGAAYHTKQALIHWLERILDQAGVVAEPEAEPEEPLTNAELLEAELWSCGRDASWVNHCLALAGMVPA